MALQIKTSIIINAVPAKVWAVFNDFKSYSEWNPFLSLIEGEVAIGKKIKIIAGGMTFKPEVLKYESEKQLQWIGRLLMPGIFDGKHNFELIDNGDGTTTFNHSEEFNGVLVAFFKNKLNKDTKAGFEKMNKALKAQCEE